MKRDNREIRYARPINTRDEKQIWHSIIEYQLGTRDNFSTSPKSTFLEPYFHLARAAAIVSISTKKKRFSGIQRCGISKPIAQKTTIKNTLQKLRLGPISLSAKRFIGKAPELLQAVLSKSMFDDSDGGSAPQVQNLPPVHNSSRCSQKLFFQNKLQSSVPSALTNKNPPDLLERKTLDLAFINNLSSLDTPNFKVDVDILALTEPNAFLGNGIDESDMYFASGPDNATDADMRSLAHNSRHPDVPAQWTKQIHW